MIDLLSYKLGKKAGGGGGSTNTAKLAPGLYETGAIELYQAGHYDAASKMLKTSWGELETNGAVAISEGPNLPDGVELNKYGFYFGIAYVYTIDNESVELLFNEDGSGSMTQAGELMELPSGTFIYGDHTIDMSALGGDISSVSKDGLSVNVMGMLMSIGDGTAKGTLYLPKFDDGTNFVFEGDLVIADEVTTFKDSTFCAQTLLTGVIIADSVTIGPVSMDLFKDCTNLTSVIIGNNITYISNSMFKNCSSLKNIKIPEGVVMICGDAFAQCDALINITIPNSVTIIENAAVCDCDNLRSVILGNGITTMADHIFDGCPKLEFVEYKGTVEQWNTIEKYKYWLRDTRVSYIQCADDQGSTI